MAHRAKTEMAKIVGLAKALGNLEFMAFSPFFSSGRKLESGEVAGKALD
jgi:hypothetical protein